MDRTLEARSWRRGFAGGFAALLFALAGQAAVSRFGSSETTSCPLAQREAPIAQRLMEKLAPPEQRGITQRVALALIGSLLLHTCS